MESIASGLIIRNITVAHEKMIEAFIAVTELWKIKEPEGIIPRKALEVYEQNARGILEYCSSIQAEVQALTPAVKKFFLDNSEFREGDIVKYKSGSQQGIVDSLELVPEGYDYIPVAMFNGNAVMAKAEYLELVERKE